jgi:hypothetical protein
MRWSAIGLTCLVAACGGSSPSPQTGALLDSLVRGTQLGALAKPVAERLQLPFLAFVGYGDTAAAPAPGLKGIALIVNEKLDSFTDRPSASARIKSVEIGFRARADVDSARARLTRTLGAPQQLCYKPGYKPAQQEVFFWPDRPGSGVLLLVPLDRSRAALLFFGAPPPESNPEFEAATRGRCETP